MTNRLINFDFDSDTEGWGNATTEANQVEVFSASGQLRLDFRGSSPRMDSPLFLQPTTDHATVVIRMAYTGVGTEGAVLFRSGSALPDPQYARGDAVWGETTPGGALNSFGVWEQRFPVIGDGRFRSYTVPLYSSRLPQGEPRLNLTQMQVQPVAVGAAGGHSARIEYIRVYEAPTILKVSGCGAVSPSAEALHTPVPLSYPVPPYRLWVRPAGTFTDQQFENATLAGTELYDVGTDDLNSTFGTTYNCLRSGGDRIRIIGKNLGVQGARVSVDGRPCLDATHIVPQQVVECTTPRGEGVAVSVALALGSEPVVQDAKPFLSFTVPPRQVANLTVSNIGATRVQLNFVPHSWYDGLATSGYVVEMRRALTRAEVLRSHDQRLPPWYEAATAGTFELEGVQDTEYVEYSYAVLAAQEAAWGPWEHAVTLGNLSTTTVNDLVPLTQYQFRVAAASEDTVTPEGVLAWQSTDLHGHRRLLRQGSVGPWAHTHARTLRFDIHFPYFDANSTLDHGAADKRSTIDPLGNQHGEGSFGLVLVGSAHVENVNASHSCCDGFATSTLDVDSDGVADRPTQFHEDGWRDELLHPRLYPPGSGSDDPVQFRAAMEAIDAAAAAGQPAPHDPVQAQADREAAEAAEAALVASSGIAARFSSCRLAASSTARLRPLYRNGEGLRSSSEQALPTPLPGSVPVLSYGPAGQSVGGPLGDGVARRPRPATVATSGFTVGPLERLARPPTAACGPALRLTASQARSVGAAWYARQQDVREGFETSFVVRVSNPSTHCMVMDDQHTQCRSRGGDGFAFVIQNLHPAAVGFRGRGLGYDGLRNSLAVEFDTFPNWDKLDPHENHVSVHTRGWRSPNSANHSYSLGHGMMGVPDLTDELLRVRLVYEPEFKASMMEWDSFVANTQFTDLLTNTDYLAGGQGEWGIGFGTLAVYLNDHEVPVLVVPLNLDASLRLRNGRAWVGFTAATGDNVFQVHDILEWRFNSLRRPFASVRQRSPALEVGGQGRAECSGVYDCPHPR